MELADGISLKMSRSGGGVGEASFLREPEEGSSEDGVWKPSLTHRFSLSPGFLEGGLLREFLEGSGGRGPKQG